MTRDEFAVVCNAYIAKFGSDPGHPPLDLGHANLKLEQLAAHMQTAIDTGEPINWYVIYPPLPEGSLS